MGLLGKNLETEMKVSPEAMVEFKRYRKKATTAAIINGTGHGLLIGGLIADDNGTQTGLYIGGLVAVGVSVGFAIPAGNSLRRSVWLRNRDALLVP